MAVPVLQRVFSNLLGPAAVMAAGTMGAGAAASLILTGAWFRYELLWVIPLILPIFRAVGGFRLQGGATQSTHWHVQPNPPTYSSDGGLADFRYQRAGSFVDWNGPGCRC